MNIKMFIDIAIKELIPNKSFRYVGSIVDEKSFYEKFNIVVGKDKINSAILSNNKDDFGITWDQVYSKMVELDNDFKSKQYQRDRLQEYPSIQELVVALYDEEDKASIIEKRNAVKEKYPKPE